MPDSRKQTVVIAVLILLIACAGWFAKKFNDQNINALSNEANTAKESTAFFNETRMGRDNTRSAMQQELQQIIDNPDSTKEARTQAQTSLMLLLDRGSKENTVETLIKELGFEDALCMITDNGVDLTLKAEGDLTSEQVNKAKDVVVRVTKFSPSNIVVKSH